MKADVEKIKVKFWYPVITFSSREVELTEKEWEDLQESRYTSKADWIMKQLEDDEDYDWVRVKDVESCLEVGYAGIKKIEP